MYKQKTTCGLRFVKGPENPPIELVEEVRALVYYLGIEQHAVFLGVG